MKHNIRFIRLENPGPEVLEAFNRWENDPFIISLSRPVRDDRELNAKCTLTLDNLAKRLINQTIYLIYEKDRLIGEMNYQADSGPLLKKEPGSAWISIVIGEEDCRNRGIGYIAMQYLEEHLKSEDIKRIELGVFEFNIRAINLYKKLGYKEIGRIDNFTCRQGKMFQEIRMEKYI